MIAAKGKSKVNFDQLRRKARQGMTTGLKGASSYLARSVRYTIRRSKKPSRPGQAPHTRTGNIKRTIAGAVEAQKASAVIGPRWGDPGKSIWNTLEHGGTTKPTSKQIKKRPYHVGDVAPIAVNRIGRVVRIKIKTEQQAWRAMEIRDKTNAIRAAGETFRIEPRPFVGPTFEKTKPKLPAFWSGTVS